MSVVLAIFKWSPLTHWLISYAEIGLLIYFTWSDSIKAGFSLSLAGVCLKISLYFEVELWKELQAKYLLRLVLVPFLVPKGKLRNFDFTSHFSVYRCLLYGVLNSTISSKLHVNLHSQNKYQNCSDMTIQFTCCFPLHIPSLIN